MSFRDPEFAESLQAFKASSTLDDSLTLPVEKVSLKWCQALQMLLLTIFDLDDYSDSVSVSSSESVSCMSRSRSPAHLDDL